MRSPFSVLKEAAQDARSVMEGAALVMRGPANLFTYLRMLPKGLPPDKSHKALLERYAGWAYICASRNAAAIAGCKLNLYATRATGQTKAGRGLKHIGKSIGTRSLKAMQSRFPHNKAIQQADEIEQIFDHPLLTMLQQVNPFTDGFAAFETTSTYLDCVGNAYWYITRDGSGVPTGFYLLPAQWMKVVPDQQQFIKGWLYGTDPNNLVALDASEVIQFRTPNPNGLFYGLGCIEATVMAVDRAHAMDVYEQSLNDNMGVPSYLIAYKGGTLPEEKRRDIERQWNNLYAGVRKAGKVKVVDNDFDVKELGIKPREMGFSEGRRWTRLEIADAFGVPISLLDTESVNRANADAGLYQYAKFTIMPRITRIEQTLNAKLLPMYDEPRLFVAYDNPVPADEASEVNRNNAYVNSGIVTINEVRAEMNMEPVPWGDEPPRSAVSVAAPESPAEGTEEEPKGEEGDNGKKAVKSLPADLSPAPTLNALLAAEYRAWFTYQAGAQIIMGPARTVIAAEYMAHASEELEHATRLTERLQELGLPVVTNLASIVAQSGADTSLPITSDAALALNIDLERTAIADYTAAIKRLADDPASVLMLTEILADEQQHLHDLEQLSSEITKGVKSGAIKSRVTVKAAGEGKVEPMTPQEKRFARAMGAVFTMQHEHVDKWIEEHAHQFGDTTHSHHIDKDILGGEWEAVTQKMTRQHINAALLHGAKIGHGKLPSKPRKMATKVVVTDDYDQYITRPEFGEFVRTYTFRFAKAVTAKTQQDLRDRISSAMDDGKSVAGVKEDIADLFNGYADYRVERIARTEVARAQTSGAREVYRDSGVVERLQWSASGDACPFCLATDGKIVNLDDDFYTKGTVLTTTWNGKAIEMNLDYEDIKAPPLHPNCRCDVIPLSPDEGD